MSGTKSHGIVYKALPEESDFYAYADAIFMNTDKCRSMTGYVCLAGEGAITWNSKSQESHALSSMGAEYVALTEAVHKACWLRNLYSELGLLREDLPTVIKGDNEGSLSMAKNPQYHKRLKHIDL